MKTRASHAKCTLVASQAKQRLMVSLAKHRLARANLDFWSRWSGYIMLDSLLCICILLHLKQCNHHHRVLIKVQVQKHLLHQWAPLQVQDLHLYPTDQGCVLHRWHHKLVVLYRWTTATAPGSWPIDSRCEATVTQVVTG